MMSGDRATDTSHQYIPTYVHTCSSNQSEITGTVYKSCRCCKKDSFDHRQEANLKFNNRNKLWCCHGRIGEHFTFIGHP